MCVKKVWLHENGEYEQRSVFGVYDSAERAMAAIPGKWRRTVWTNYPQWPDKTVVTHYDTYDREGSSDSIYSAELTTEGPTAAINEIVLQQLKPNDSRGSWEYVPISNEQANALVK